MNNTATMPDFFIKNLNSPFTELFSIVTKYVMHFTDVPAQQCFSQDRIVMAAHITNAVQSMLQGLQDIANLTASIEIDKRKDIPITTIGCFFAMVCNLIEGLNCFNFDMQQVELQRIGK